METIVTAFTTAVSTIQTDAFTMFASAIPAGLKIAGVVLVVQIGMRVFRSIAK